MFVKGSGWSQKHSCNLEACERAELRRHCMKFSKQFRSLHSIATCSRSPFETCSAMAKTAVVKQRGTERGAD